MFTKIIRWFCLSFRCGLSNPCSSKPNPGCGWPISCRPGCEWADRIAAHLINSKRWSM